VPDAVPTASLGRRLGAASLGAGLLGAAGWLALRNLSLPKRDGWIFWVPTALWLATMGLLCWGSVLGGLQPGSRARLRASWHAGWATGAVGLAIGFVAPLVLTPRSNLGPLLGILFTGPLGFVAGALGAAVARTARPRR
jgi:hypothetical protein